MQGLGTIGGFKLQVEDRTDLGYDALDTAMKAVVGKAMQSAANSPAFSPATTINVPQLNADLDRTKAQQLGVDVQDVFDTMQIYLGSLYVNDFNKFGRTYQVIAQADRDFRSAARRHPAAEDAQRRRRDGPARLHRHRHRHHRPGKRDALQRVSRRRSQRRRRARLFQRPGAGRHHQDPARKRCRRAWASSGPT